MSRSGERPAPARCLDLGHDGGIELPGAPLTQVDPDTRRLTFADCRGGGSVIGRTRKCGRGPARRQETPAQRVDDPLRDQRVEPQGRGRGPDLLDEEHVRCAELAGEPCREAVRRRLPRWRDVLGVLAPWRLATTPALYAPAGRAGFRPCEPAGISPSARAAKARPYCSMASSAMWWAAASPKPISAARRAPRRRTARRPAPGRHGRRTTQSPPSQSFRAWRESEAPAQLDDGQRRLSNSTAGFRVALARGDRIELMHLGDFGRPLARDLHPDPARPDFELLDPDRHARHPRVGERPAPRSAPRASRRTRNARAQPARECRR